MPKGKYTLADVAPEQAGKYTAADIAPAETPDGPKTQGFFSSAADSSGLSGIASALQNPGAALRALPGGISDMIHNTTGNVAQGISDFQKEGLTEKTRRDFGRAVPIVGPTLAKAQSQQDAGNTAGMLGSIGGLVGGLVAPTVLKGAPGLLSVAGEAAQDTGVGVLGKTAGLLKGDFKRGAEPARAYLEAGGGPAMSMQGLADKAATLKRSVGQQIGDVRESATRAGVRIPAAKVASALQPGIAKGIDLETGAGGSGATVPIENYSATFRPDLQKAAQSGGFTPNEVADIKSRIAQNTNWSDPSQFNLKAIRQQNNGALSGLLSDELPELQPLNSQYQGLANFSKRTAERAATHSMPLSAIAAKGIVTGTGAIAGGLAGHSPLLSVAGGLGAAAATSTPAQTALASGLYLGGSGLRFGGRVLAPLEALPMKAVAPYNLIANPNKRAN